MIPAIRAELLARLAVIQEDIKMSEYGRVFEPHENARQYVINRPGKSPKAVWVNPVPHILDDSDRPCPRACGATEAYEIIDPNPEFWSDVKPGTVPAACAGCGYFVE